MNDHRPTAAQLRARSATLLPPRAAKTLLIVACLLGTAMLAPASSLAALPPQGLYDHCYPTTASHGCVDRLERMAGAGFRVVLNYSLLTGRSTAAGVRSYLDSAAAAGIQVIPSLAQPRLWTAPGEERGLLLAYPLLAATCGCLDNAGFIKYLVALLDHPATWGYYVADEPQPELHDALKGFVAQIKSADPSRPALLVACGICSGVDPNGTRVAPFADIDAVLGTDSYPITDQPPDADRVFKHVAGSARGVQAVADRAGRESAMVLQAWNWGDSPEDSAAIGLDPARGRFPSEQELRAQRDATLLNSNPRVILWFGYFDIFGWDPAVGASVWTHPANSEERWSALVRAAFAPEPGPSVAISRRPVRLTSRGLVRVRLQAKVSQRGTIAGSLKLQAAPKRRSRSGRAASLGRRSFRIRPGRSTVVRMPLSRAARRLVHRRGKLRVRATTQVRGRASDQATVMLTLRARAPRS